MVRLLIGNSCVKFRKETLFFHSYQRHIVAVSKATSNCYPAVQPSELAVEHLWENNGLKVDSVYCSLPDPLDTKTIMPTLLELQPTKYAPFNVRGWGNTGYLFNVTPENGSLFVKRTETFFWQSSRLKRSGCLRACPSFFSETAVLQPPEY